MNAIVFVPSVSAVENLPTVWVKVYRIQTVDNIETGLEGEADWRYTIAVTDGETTVTREFKCKSNIGDNIVDRLDSFPDIHSKSMQVTITVYEDDTGGYETADVSSSGMSFECTYNLVSNALGGDETVIDGKYYKNVGRL